MLWIVLQQLPVYQGLSYILLAEVLGQRFPQSVIGVGYVADTISKLTDPACHLLCVSRVESAQSTAALRRLRPHCHLPRRMGLRANAVTVPRAGCCGTHLGGWRRHNALPLLFTALV